ncbi:MAG: hypothetical protein GEU88_10295 [Solirubrobacterales bacterium]|nr:hypothetical protein [Solirubrobacterales bacterium]
MFAGRLSRGPPWALVLTVVAGTATMRELAELAAAAKTNHEIAATLYISETTVEKHRSKVCAKLGVIGRVAIGARLAADRDGAERS